MINIVQRDGVDCCAVKDVKPGDVFRMGSDVDIYIRCYNKIVSYNNSYDHSLKDHCEILCVNISTGQIVGIFPSLQVTPCKSVELTYSV